MAWEEVGGTREGRFIKWETPGQTIVGVWIEKFEGKQKDNPVGVLEGYEYLHKEGQADEPHDGDDETIKFSMTVQLQEKLYSVKPGDMVRIMYMGLMKTLTNRTYKAFRVWIDRKSGEPDDVPA